MKKLALGIALLGMFIVTTAATLPTEIDTDTQVEGAFESHSVRFYNKCSSSQTFYIKGNSTSSYSVGAKSSKNVSCNVGDVILDSGRDEITTISSGDDKVTICD